MIASAERSIPVNKLTMLAALCGVLAFGCGAGLGPRTSEDEDLADPEIVHDETRHCPEVCTEGLDSPTNPGVEDQQCTAACTASGVARVRTCASDVTILQGKERERYIRWFLEKLRHPD